MIYKCFGSVEDIEAVLIAGIKVIVEYLPRDKFLEFPHGFIELDAKPRRYVIHIPAVDSFTRTFATWQTTLLEEQLVTLIHELIHAYRVEVKFNTPDCLLAPIKYEEEVEVLAYYILKNTPNLVEEIVKTIANHPNCKFEFCNKATPLYTFIFNLMSSCNGGLVKNLKYFNKNKPEQLKLFKL